MGFRITSYNVCYTKLLRVTHDTWQLFQDMHHYNPYAGEKRQAFMTAMQRIEDKLGEKK